MSQKADGVAFFTVIYFFLHSVLSNKFFVPNNKAYNECSLSKLFLNTNRLLPFLRGTNTAL